MRSSLPLLLLLVARLGTAQAPTAAGSTVRGVVHDSLARAPLAGARVQLVAADTLARFGHTVVADSAGRFAFDDVPAGQYTLGFFHPLLDSIGIEPLLRGVRVDGQRAVRADLAIPAPERLRAAICGPGSADRQGGVVVGVVRDASGGAPAAGVTVVADWIELSLGRAGMSHRRGSRATTTKEGGWFAVCDVPSPGTMTLTAARGADSTDRVEVEVPAGGFLRRELYLGAARLVLAADSAPPADTATAAPPRRIQVGDGRISGTVVAAGGGGRPLAGARVSITNGPSTRTNERGQWTIANAPTGTRALEVRAVGYYPERRTVDVVDGAGAVNVSLATLKSVLATVRVTANYDRYEKLQGFQQRSRGGMGRFLNTEEIARRDNGETSDLFRMLPGVYVDNRHPDARILMRGMFEDRCAPDIYINGAVMSALSIADLDAFVRPKELVGIEVYSPGMVPSQFQLGMGGCGSIVIWTK